jgi:hypothetical protein
MADIAREAMGGWDVAAKVLRRGTKLVTVLTYELAHPN